MTALVVQVRLGISLLILLMVTALPIGAQTETAQHGIMLTDAVVQRIQVARTTNARTAAVYKVLLDDAEAYLKQPTIVETVRGATADGTQTFQGFNQKPVEHLTTLGLAWRLTGDHRFSERLRTELVQLSNLESWYPEQFLDLSRVTLAVALGYNWIGETLSESDHTLIRNALVNNALAEAKKIYDLDQEYFDTGWVVPQRWINPTSVPRSLPDGTALADITWPVASFNWNIICNSGMIAAALAVSQAEPDLSKRIIQSAQVSLRNGFAVFAPDGAWPEGPMYGALSARDVAGTISALNSALGHDFALSNSDGLEGFGDFLIHVTGPTGLLFNYGDSDTSTDLVALNWFASHFNRPEYMRFLSESPPSSHPALALIWDQVTDDQTTQSLPTSAWFGGLGLVTMRSDWSDPEAVFVGFKAGPLLSHHNNLDAGTFVLDAKGVRWAVDLGVGNYDLPGYFLEKRFDYYRTATIGQNTLTFGIGNQQTIGRAQVEEFAQFPDYHFAIADLSDPYGKPLGAIRRGIALIGKEKVLVQDEINGQTEPVAWTMHTEAKITLDGQNAILSQDGQALHARILSPSGAQFSVRSADPCHTPFDAECKEQNPNTGVSRLMIERPAQAPDAGQTIAVIFEAGEVTDPPDIIPLTKWRLRATLQSGGNQR